MPQARFSRRRTKGDMLKFRIHFLRRKQLISKLVSSKKVMLSFSSTALFSFKIHLFEKLLSRRSPRAVTDIATLFSASLTTRNRSNSSRGVLEKKGFFSNVTCLPDTRRTDAFKFEWTRTREQHMRGFLRYPLHTRSTIPRTSLGRFPEEAERIHPARGSVGRGIAISLSPGDSVKLQALPRPTR